jgi:hypothetical protein
MQTHHHHHHQPLPTRGCLKVFAALVAAVGCLMVGVSSAAAFRGHVFSSEFGWGVQNGKSELQQCTSGCQPGIAGSGAGQLKEPEAIAVNERTGNVYIADKGNNRIDEYTATGVFVAAWGWGVQDGKPEYQTCTTLSGCQAGIPGTGEGQLLKPRSITIDNTCDEAADPTTCEAEDVNAEDIDIETGEYGEQYIERFTATGIRLPPIRGPPFKGGIEGIATDHEGNLYVLTVPATGIQQGVDRFEGKNGDGFAGFVGASTGGFDEHGFAVDALHDFFIRQRVGGVVAEFSSGGVLLDAAVGGLGGVGFNGVAVESATGDAYVDNSVIVQRLQPFDAELGESPVVEELGGLPGGGCREENLSCLGGVVVDSVSGRVFVVAGGSSLVQVFALEPPNVPVVQDEAVSKVTSGSVQLSGEVNPRSESVEGATSYWFEYVGEEQFSREGFAGALRVPVPAGQLAASYELSSVGVGVGGLSAGVSYRYRLVAENTRGRAVGEERLFTTQPAGAFGLLDGRGWELVSPPDKQGALLEPRNRVTYLAVQAAAGGGAVTYIATEPTEAEPAGNAGFTQVFSWRGAGGWGTRDLVVPHERATAVTEHPEWPLFSENLLLAVAQPLGPFDAGLSAQASEQTAYLHTNLQGASEACVDGCYTPLVMAANTPAGTVFGIREEGPESKSETCPPNPFCGPQFEAASPDLEHVVVHSRAALTGGTVGPEGALFEWNEGRLAFVGEGEAGDGRAETTENFLTAGSRSVSRDGSRVVFRGPGDRGLFLRDTVTGELVQLSGARVVFLGASSDDSRVFFENEAGGGGPLQECEIVEEAGGLACRLINLTPGAIVLGPIPGVSESGESVYFVSPGVLTGTEKDPGGQAAVASRPNLYVSVAGTIRLIAVLSSGDASDWGNEEYLSTPNKLGRHNNGKIRRPANALTGLTARVSPDGQWLAFVSELPLTGYESEGASEVYLYHASAGSLVCVSCDATGARPLGSASVPGWTTSLYQSRYLSDGGRLFFDSPDPLVPQDTNKTEDVYEYEPPADGESEPSGDTCTRLSLTYGSASQGCVDLVSSGSSPEPSSFLDASENGDDVFFLTAEQLSSRDKDTTFDVYDARVGGEEHELEKPVECQGDACQAPVSAPEDITPGSLSFSGPGNLAPAPPPPVMVKKKTAAQIKAEQLARALKVCHKKKDKHKRVVCEREARKRYTAKKPASKKGQKR